MKKIKLLLINLFLTNLILAQSNIEYKVDSLLQKYNRPDYPGISIGIVQNGKLIYSKGFGLANLDYAIQNSDTSKFDIASIAKQFTAACVWKLIQQEKINLDDDIRKYLPELPFYGDTIRIRHMLNHTSGLRDYAPLMELAGIDYKRMFFNNDSVFALACRQKGVNNIPGEKVLYENTPYNLLTIIIERVSGEGFSDFAKKYIFIPLGMYNTMYRTDNISVVKNRAVGYVQNKDGSFSNFPRIESCYGAGSLWSTVRDMALWTNIFTDKNHEYKDLATFLIEKDTLLSGELASYSRGVMVDNYKNKQTIHHSGFTQGYQSQVISLPEIELSVIIFTNLQSINQTPISYQILDLFLKDPKTENNQIESFTPTKKQLQAYVGQYQEKNSSLGMEIICKNDTLMAKSSLGRMYIPLIASAENTFHRIDNESVKYIFTTNSKDSVMNLTVYFGATPFYFEPIVLFDLDLIVNEEYIGKYYSGELNVTYTIFEENGNLYLSYPNRLKIRLFPRQKDEFGNGYRTLYRFIRQGDNKIDKLLVASEGIVKDIEFIRIE